MEFEKNVGAMDANVRIVLAVALVVIDYLLNYGIILKVVLAVIALLLVFTGVTKSCYAYKILGIKT